MTVLICVVCQMHVQVCKEHKAESLCSACKQSTGQGLGAGQCDSRRGSAPYTTYNKIFPRQQCRMRSGFYQSLPWYFHSKKLTCHCAPPAQLPRTTNIWRSIRDTVLLDETLSIAPSSRNTQLWKTGGREGHPWVLT